MFREKKCIKSHMLMLQYSPEVILVFSYALQRYGYLILSDFLFQN